MYTYMHNNMVFSLEIDLTVAFVNIIVKCKRVKRTMIKLASLNYRKKNQF